MTNTHLFTIETWFFVSSFKYLIYLYRFCVILCIGIIGCVVGTLTLYRYSMNVYSMNFLYPIYIGELET